MTTYNTPQESQGTPLKAFDTRQTLSTIDWSTIASEITAIGNDLIFPSSGLVLCAFAICYIEQTPAFKLPHITLDQGTECVKQLYQIHIAASTELTDKDKATAIQ